MDRETIEIWLSISKNDLISSKILFEKGMFRNSYFLFQQATEKANKAFALQSENLNENELKQIQHDQIKIYRKAIAKQEKSMSESIEFLKNFGIPENIIKHSNSLKESLRLIDSLKNYDLVNFKTEELNSFLELLKSIKDLKLELPNNFRETMQSHMLSFADLIGNFDINEAADCKKEIQDLIFDKDQSELLFDTLQTKIFPRILDLMFINFTLYFCAILTIQHSSLTRYPSDGINPESIYVKKLPIIDNQMEFMNLLSEAIVKMDKINSNE